MQALVAISGVTAFRSEANMILIRVADAQKTFERMRSCKVLIKNVSNLHALLHNCLRITVGTADENAKMLTALKESLAP